MHRTGLQLADMKQAMIGGHRVLVNKATHVDVEAPTVAQTLQDSGLNDIVEHESEGHDVVSHEMHPPPPFDRDILRPSKWLKTHGFVEVSPTIPYEVNVIEEKPCPKVGLQYLPAPSLRELLDQCHKAQEHLCKKVNGDILKVVIFASLTSRWSVLTWAPHGKTVAKLLCMILPHFRFELVKNLTDHDTEIECDMIPYANPFRVIRFCPIDILCQLQLTCDQNQVIIHPANLTTKASDWITEFAARFKVPACMIEIRKAGVVVAGDTFILSSNCRSFSLHWVVPYHVPFVHPIAADASGPLDLQVALQQDGEGDQAGAAVNIDGLVCFAAQHPLWKTIRTIAMSSQTPLFVVIGRLFPDLVAQITPVIEAGGIIMPSSTKIADIPSNLSLQVELNGDRPIPTFVLHRIPAQVGLCLFPSRFEVGDKPYRRWIRSPFKVQTTEFELPGDLSLLELGSSFFSQMTSAQTVQVTVNHKLVDPSLLIKETPCNDTISFKLCPLPGGAKNELGSIITQALKSRGVPVEVVDARTKSILATIPQDQIRSHVKEPEVTFWASLKRLASEHKIRLVTPSELKNFQKEQRNAKKPSIVPDPPVKGKGKGAKGGKGTGISQKDATPKIDLASVQLQTQYLSAEGRSGIPVLPKADFGVDKQGVTLMTSTEAEAFFPVKSLSTGPLAILAICDADASSSAMVMLPAINNASEPILLPVVIHNFGDVPVRFHPGDMNVNTLEVATQVIEVIIRRNLVEDWSKVRDGLQYLASHNPSLKGGSIIAHWSFKPYNSSKKPSSLDQAAYIHGYFRCKTECVDEVLKTSGSQCLVTTIVVLILHLPSFQPVRSLST